VLVSDRTDVAQGIDEMPRRHVLPFPIQRSLQTLRIPGYDAVREEGQGAGLLSLRLVSQREIYCYYDAGSRPGDCRRACLHDPIQTPEAYYGTT
jgi:hypothetical protein